MFLLHQLPLLLLQHLKCIPLLSYLLLLLLVLLVLLIQVL